MDVGPSEAETFSAAFLRKLAGAARTTSATDASSHSRVTASPPATTASLRRTARVVRRSTNDSVSGRRPVVYTELVAGLKEVGGDRRSQVAESDKPDRGRHVVVLGLALVHFTAQLREVRDPTNAQSKRGRRRPGRRS